MLNKNKQRELAYLVKVDKVEQMDADRLEAVDVGGWKCVCGKGEFHPGDVAIYIEIDAQCPIDKKPWSDMAFLVSKKGKIKSQKIRGVISQGLLIPTSQFADICAGRKVNNESRFLTKELGITYAIAADNVRKGASSDKYKKMAQRRSKLSKKWWWKKLYKSSLGKKILFVFFGKKNDNATAFPTKFPGVGITDQERCENMIWVLQDKTPFIVTQKCDGSSGTFILERKKFGRYEFYVCSRNVRQLSPEQKCFHDKNYYWQVAIKYDIENKMKTWLKAHPKAWFVCWQGEVCGPEIQGNPQHLKSTHLFCFHWTDSINGRRDIREADKDWRAMGMEVVPIEGTIVLPDNFEEFKQMADGKYDPSVCEGHTNCNREGWVLYSTKDSKFSFKNVSRKYLLGKKD